jgi:NAD+ kinase
VIPASSRIDLNVQYQDSEAILTVDGQVNLKIPSGKTVHVRKGDFYVHLVTLPGHSFFNLLREKLQWGSLPHK